MHPSIEKIKTAAEGLFFMSESDYPFEVVEINTSASELEKILKKSSGHEEDALLGKQTPDYFFRNSAIIRPEDGDEQKALAQRFIHLKEVLNETLSGIEVYRIGQVQVDVFIIGLLEEGKYAGLKTKSIET